MALPKFLTPKQLAELLHKKESALAASRHFRRGIPYHKVDGRILYAEADVLAYLEATRQETQEVV